MHWRRLVLVMGIGLLAACSPPGPTATAPGLGPGGAGVSAQPRVASTPAPTVAASPVGGPTTTPAPTTQPAPNATPRPTPKPTPKPAPRPTPKPTAKPTGVYGNPWGYTFAPGNLIYNPPAAFCDYFPCIASFWTSTNGYVEECADGDFSHSGGRSGSCSYHGGNYRPLYSH